LGIATEQSPERVKYRLRYQQHDFELNDGQFVIGRGADCQLALDDALVSRRHAMLSVHGDAVYVEDLGSRNGVKVNGSLLQEKKRVGDGDRLRIGNQEMTVLRVQRVQATTLAQPAPTLKADAFGLLGGLADKALAMGRGEEAERILGVHLTNVLTDAKDGRRVAPDMAKQASLYAAKLAAATGKGKWVDYVFELFAIVGRPCPAEVVDELYAVVRKVSGVNLGLLRGYMDQLRAVAKAPSERFLLNRIEGLERLIALK
jgi:hypothetical protein